MRVLVVCVSCWCLIECLVCLFSPSPLSSPSVMLSVSSPCDFSQARSRFVRCSLFGNSITPRGYKKFSYHAFAYETRAAPSWEDSITPRRYKLVLFSPLLLGRELPFQYCSSIIFPRWYCLWPGTPPQCPRYHLTSLPANFHIGWQTDPRSIHSPSTYVLFFVGMCVRFMDELSVFFLVCRFSVLLESHAQYSGSQFRKLSFL